MKDAPAPEYTGNPWWRQERRMARMSLQRAAINRRKWPREGPPGHAGKAGAGQAGEQRCSGHTQALDISGGRDHTYLTRMIR